MTWYQVFWTSPKGGNAWYILAHQYMAAELNLLGDGGTVPNLDAWLDEAKDILMEWDNQKNIPKKDVDRARAIYLAGQLAMYNEGVFSSHCGEAGFAGFTTVTSAPSSGVVLPPVGFLPFLAAAKRRVRAA